MPLSFGDKLGPYDILVPIGAGGMGQVYRAHDSRLNRDVAIKVSAAQFSERFEREAKAIAALNHPNICQVYDVGPNYLVMELIEGTLLTGPLALDQALRYAAQICDALDAAHKKNIIHRDLKPANILVTPSGVKLLDFGLAKIAMASITDGATESMALSEPGAVMGTPAYMSPEQAKGEAVDARSDIFSFGAVLYEVLSGRRAFARNSSVETMSAILRDEPSPLDAPTDISNIVTRCLRKSPGERFPTVGEVRAALEQASTKPVEKQPSIAVLPFVNMSADKENEYFSDGLAEEIINALAQVPRLKVIARTSAFAFKGQNTDIRRIAKELGVAHVLEGSVRKAGIRIRVAAQLVAATDGSHLWSERYDREMADIFAVQDEIAQGIVAAIRGKLSPQVPGRPRYTPKLPAYEAVLRAWHHQWKFTPDSVDRGRECYEQAIALDPVYAVAHSGYAHHFFMTSVMGLSPPHEAMPLMRAAARKAVELDPSLSEAQGLLGIVAAVYDYDWKEAEQRFQLATSRDPVPPMVRIWRGYWFLQILGRPLEALAEQERALQEDPLNVVVRFGLSAALSALGRYTEGDQHLREARELDERSWQAHLYLGLSLASRGMLDESLSCAEKAYSLAPWSAWCQGLLAGVLSRAGVRSRVQGLLQDLQNSRRAEVALGLTIFNLVRLETNEAADWAGKAIEQRDPQIGVILRHPLAESLRNSRHWPVLAKMLSLPDA